MFSVHRGKSAWFWRWMSRISWITGGISVSVTHLTPGSGFDQMPASGVWSNPAGRSMSWCFLKCNFRFPWCQLTLLIMILMMEWLPFVLRDVYREDTGMALPQHECAIVRRKFGSKRQKQDQPCEYREVNRLETLYSTPDKCNYPSPFSLHVCCLDEFELLDFKSGETNKVVVIFRCESNTT